MHLREVKMPKTVSGFYPWTDLLTPGRQYFVIDDKGVCRLLWWEHSYVDGRWLGSSWYDAQKNPNAKPYLQRRVKPIFIEAVRVCELPGVQYDRPIRYSRGEGKVPVRPRSAKTCRSTEVV